MKIIKDSAVALRYEILDEDGKDAGEGKQEAVYLHGGYGNIFPKVEAELEGKEPGEKARVTLSPEEGFGRRDPSLVRREPRDRLPGKLKVGMQFEGEVEIDGNTHPLVFRLTQLTDTEATLDGNHPLAGRTIEFRCTVLDVRPATREEIAHGHVHGPDGHHHH